MKVTALISIVLLVAVVWSVLTDEGGRRYTVTPILAPERFVEEIQDKRIQRGGVANRGRPPRKGSSARQRRRAGREGGRRRPDQGHRDRAFDRLRT